MTNERFDFLVNEVISRNGTAQQFLAKLVEDQEISPTEEKKILFAAKVAMLTKRVEQLCSIIE